MSALKLNLKKFHSFLEFIDYLGDFREPGKQHVLRKTTKAVQKIRYLEYLIQVRLFLGLSNFYSRLIAGHGNNKIDLNMRLKKSKQT